MNIEIIGRHALFFDDDTTAAFVNSDDALVEWNSLLIDRYDVRHLLSTPPPSRRRRHPQTTHSSSADAEIDYERYLDLLSQPDEQEEDAETEKPEPVGGFNAVPFSYGTYEDCNDQKTAETESEISGFYPPFPVPDSLLQNLILGAGIELCHKPPTEKVHQIVARTALFVSKNGGQSEIVLRVKQGDNPTFGFLMPDHHLHPYFRFLVDHQDLLQSKDDGQPKTEEKTSNTGALSLLGSVYGTGEDDDSGVEHPSSSSSSKECVSGNTMDVDATSSLTVGKAMLPAEKDEPVSERLLSSKKDTSIIKKNSQTNALKSGRTGSLEKGESLGLLSAVPDKSRASSLPPLPKTEHMLLVDPPSDMKRLVDKIVEFIIRNGRQFEAVLMEQDRGHGRFPFLLPSNIFHPYYLKVLQKAEEPKLTVKSLQNEKEDIRGHMIKKKSISKENGNSMVESDDIPLDSERKEKFKMVINKCKKEGLDLPAKEPQQQLGVQMDAAQVAAILQAATRGITHPNLGTLFGKSSNEAESSDSNMTHEQKLKAERLKRAKMFVAKLKNGAAPSKAEPSRGLSAEPPQPQGSEADNHLAAKERERSSTPIDIDTLDKRVKSEKELLDEERRAKRKYRARGEPAETQEDEEEDVEGDEREERSHRHHKKKHRSHNHSAEDESEEKYEDERDYKHAKRRHRSHRSSHKRDDTDQGNDEKDHKYSRKNLRRSSYDDSEEETEHEYSRKKHRSRHFSHDVASDDEVDSDHKYSRKKHSHKSRHRSHRSSHHSRDKHKHRKSYSSSHRQNASLEDESRDRNKADKHVKGSNSEREELEEGEISSKSDQSKGGALVNREPSVDVDVSSSLQDQRPPRQPSETTTDVPDDLRAKIRAMLMSTM